MQKNMKEEWNEVKYKEQINKQKQTKANTSHTNNR
jgi:hypothetical protein